MTRHVSAASDYGLAAYRDVGDHAALERAGLFVAEGRLIVQRLLEDGRFRVHSVVVTPPAAAALASTFENRPDITVLVCNPELLHEITGFDFHRGCLALARRKERGDELALATTILALEGVGNPDNIGGLFRSAFALGVDGILLDPATGDPLYRKAIRTSMGSTLRVPYARATTWPGELDALRARGFQVIALTPHPDAVSLDAVDVTATMRIILLVGSEGAGLGSDAMRASDMKVRIPLNPRADSLNVVVAASIALHALRGGRAHG